MSRANGVRWVYTSAVLASTTVAAAGLWWRPVGSDNQNSMDGATRAKHDFISKFSLTDTADQSPPTLQYYSSQAVITAVTLIARTYLHYFGKFEVIKDEHYQEFIKNISARDDGVALLTVSNHRSRYDDPMLFTGIVPFWMSFQPKYLRYGFCSEEYCFNSKLPSLAHAFIGLGKALPIVRGEGINQKFLLDFARLIAAGKWCHVFPEGGIWQLRKLGGRDVQGYTRAKRSNDSIELADLPRASIGKLKWGVGKLIAHAPTHPIVIPFYHSGTDQVNPQDADTKNTPNLLPTPGHDIKIRFGPKVYFNDLIDAHEKEYGPLRKYKASIAQENLAGYDEADFHSHWDSTKAERILYSKIVSRIEAALCKLNLESNNEELRRDE